MSRDGNIRSAMSDLSAKTQAVKNLNRAKKMQTSPAKAVEEAWFEAFALHFPQRQSSKWWPNERKRIVSQLKDVTVESMVEDVKYYISSWCVRKNQIPSLSMFWAVKDQVNAERAGAIKPSKQFVTKEEKMQAGEFQPEAAKKFPRIG